VTAYILFAGQAGAVVAVVLSAVV